MTKLKPCPFCGGEAELVDYGLNARYKAVTCGECGARTRLFSSEIGIGGEFAVVEEWNRREKSEEPEQDWILCSKRLPEVDESVLVTHMRGVIRARWDGKGWKSPYQRPYLKTVTAWKPLPEPYCECKEGEQNDD